MLPLPPYSTTVAQAAKSEVLEVVGDGGLSSRSMAKLSSFTRKAGGLSQERG